MSVVPPPAPSFPLPTAATAQATAVAIIERAVGEAAKMAAGQVVEAQVTAVSRNQVTVMTPLGEMLLRLPTPVPDNARLTLQVMHMMREQQTARLLSVNGRPFAATTPAGTAVPAGAPAAGGASPLPAASATAAGHAPATTLAGGAAGATAGPAGAAALGGVASALPVATVVRGLPLPGLPALPTGAAFPVRMVTVIPPASNPPATAAPAAAGPAAVLAQPTSVAAPAMPAAPAFAAAVYASPAAGAGATPSFPGMPPAPGIPTPPGAPAPAPSHGTAPAPSPLPTTIAGTVTINTHAGQPLVQTPVGLLSLANAGPIPPGAAVSFEVVGPPSLPPMPPPLPAAAPAQATAATAGRWPALEQALPALRTSDPAEAQQLAQRLPQPGPRLAVDLAIVAGALRAGTFSGWLGETPLRALERSGHRDLARRLDDELNETGTQSRTAPGAEWRIYTMPFLNGVAIEPIRLSVRRPPPEDDEQEQGGGEAGTRFLIDVTLSRIGPLQLDGLVKRSVRRFDLILRTRHALPAEVRGDIAGIFGRCLDELNLAGTTTFMVSPRFVEPHPGLPAGGAWQA